MVLKEYSNDIDVKTTKVCKEFGELKENFWDTTNTDDWTETELNFKVNVEVQDDDNEVLKSVSHSCRKRKAGLVVIQQNDQNRQLEIAKAVRDKRKFYRNIIVKRANELRKAIRELKPVEVSEVDLSKQFSDWVGYANKIANNGDVTRGWKKYMTRLVVVKFLQSLGFTDDMRREIVTDKSHPENKTKVDEPNFSDVSLNGAESLANDGYWAKYVESLSGLPIIQKTESSLLTSVSDSAKDAVYGAVSVDDVKKLLENRSWSEGKKGGILFGYQGDTYELKGKQVEKIETIEPSFKSISENSGDIDAWEKERLIVFMKKLREELAKI